MSLGLNQAHVILFPYAAKLLEVAPFSLKLMDRKSVASGIRTKQDALLGTVILPHKGSFPYAAKLLEFVPFSLKLMDRKSVESGIGIKQDALLGTVILPHRR